MWKKERCEYNLGISDFIRQHIPETNAQVGIKFRTFVAQPVVMLESAFF